MSLEAELARIRAENARLRRLLDLTAEQARPPRATQTGLVVDHPGPVAATSPAADKVRFFRRLFASRTDVYAIGYENRRIGRSGWVPAVEGGWRKGTSKPYLRLTDTVVEAHLTGEVHIGLYPMLRDDTCHWLAADFDGPSAMLDALSYLKAARAVGVPGALEVSRSGTGAHVWVFFEGPVRAETARTLGSGLVREAIALRGRMDLAGYDRLFPAQDVLPAGGIGNLIAAPLQGRLRKDGATVFLDPGTLEPFDDQWAYLSSLHRLSPGEVGRLAARIGPVRVGSAVGGLREQTSSKIRPQAAGNRRGRPGSTSRHRHRGAHASDAGHAEARRFHGEPRVLRPAASSDVDVGCAEVPAQLRRDVRWAAHAPAWLARCRRHRGRGGGEHPGDRR